MSSIDSPEETHLSYATTPDASNATFIDYSTVREHQYWKADFQPLKKRDWYKKLDRYNSGEFNGVWVNKAYKRNQESHRIISRTVSILELNDHQRRAAKRWFMSFDFEKWGLPKELIAYCLCAYLVHSDPDDVRRCHPQTPIERMDAQFEAMERAFRRSEDTTLGKSILDSVYQKVQRKVAGRGPPDIVPFDKYIEEDIGPFIEDSSEIEWANPEGGI